MEEESSSFCEGDKLNEEGFTVIVNTEQEQIIRKLSIKKGIKVLERSSERRRRIYRCVIKKEEFYNY